MSLNHNVSHLLMTNASNQLDSVLKLVLLSHLLQVDELWSISCDQEMDIWSRGTKSRNNSSQQIRSFILEQSGNNNHSDLIQRRFNLCGTEIVCNHCIGYHRNQRRVQTGTQHRVFLTRMTDTYHVTDVCQSELQQLVAQYGSHVGETKERVICEHRSDSHCVGVQYGFVAHGAEGAVAVDKIDIFSNEDLANNALKGLGMANQDTYVGVPNTPPEDPPEYTGYEGSSEEAGHFEQFDIDEPAERARMSPRELFHKAGDFAKNFNRRFFRPINNALDPVYELYQFINNKTESYMSKIGNPLIIKRLVYVLFIATIVYVISMSGMYPDGVNSLYGDFYDVRKLLDFIDTHVDVNRLEENLEYLSSIPHMAGTAGDLALARYMEDIVADSAIQLDGDSRFIAYVNYPEQSSVKLLQGDKSLYECVLNDKPDYKDGENDSVEIHQRAFNPGSMKGSAKGPLVYANYGTTKDYEKLKDLGIQIKGSVLVIKYGGILKESKKLYMATEEGAAGVIFISDPKLSSVYTMTSIQKEPVALPDYYTGNMISPGPGVMDRIPDYFDVDIMWQSNNCTPRIPSIPISWKDFKNLMSPLKGYGKRISEWEFDLDNEHLEIWTGAADFVLDLSNKVVERMNKEVWNVIGRISGSEQNNLAIVIGAPRDSSCYGTTDSTGSVILLELITLFSNMMSTLKWKPLRSIYFVSFSATDYNLAGSTYFAQSKNDLLNRQGYTYIDLSNAVSGSTLEIAADPILHSLIKDVLNIVEDPITNRSLSDVWDNNFGLLTDNTKNYEPYISHFGMPAAELRFKGQDYPKNTCLDTFKKYKDDQIDSEMAYHKTLTRMVAKIILQLTEKPIIPYDIFNMVSTINKNMKDLRAYAEYKDKNAKLDFTQFDTSLIKLKTIAREQQSFIKTWTEIVNADSGSEPNLLAVNRWDWNAKLVLLEKILQSSNGIFDRPWHRNVLFGNEFKIPEIDDHQFNYNSFPGVRDAIDAQDWKEAQNQLSCVSDSSFNISSSLESIMVLKASSTVSSFFSSRVRTSAITCFTNFRLFKNSWTGLSWTFFIGDSLTCAAALVESRSKRYVSRYSWAIIPRRTFGRDFLKGISVANFLHALLSLWNLSRSSWFRSSSAMILVVIRSEA
ncbi:hypothetical protein OGAPHI_004131 [Ogataea philodendri]|uniref:Uncharacterized protein n=1 Tax=Ogataea philodendri TaxID=1378263 RepID=A0A9P8P638_9ASCO|nr:uncharacterized protein OGAPHI_004131 [Ogataea philodendri]KAH3665942.1 hypothetical protein OGAPHI_004131 [Ogataea philodendri]